MLCRWLPCVVLLVCRLSELLIDFIVGVDEDDLHSYIDSYLDSRYYYYYVIKLNLSIIITIIRILLSKVEEEELISVHVISNTSNFNL